MSLTLFAHPFSSYSQKVLIALYENNIAFKYRLLGPEDPSAFEELEARWPFKHFPILVDEDRTIAETSIILEYLAQRHPGPCELLPKDAAGALETRFMDRCFDQYVMTPMQTIVLDLLRPADCRDPYGVDAAHKGLDRAYGWLNERLAGREWAAGAEFTMADCAAAPALFYADWVEPIGAQFPNVSAYRRRLLSRASIARAVDEARPYRKFFPPGAPDRD